MHETGLMQRLLEDAAGAAGGRRLLGMTVRVGALCGAVPEALRFAFEALTEGTGEEGMWLELKEEGARFRCEGCGEVFEAAVGGGYACPACGGIGGEVVSGRELELESIEVDDV